MARVAIKRRYTEYADTDSSQSETELSDDDFLPTRKSKKVKPSPKPPNEAKVKISAGADMDSIHSLPENIDQTTLERIKKALNLSKHPGTTENEARQAMRLAMKLMAKLNITQAQVLESMEENDDISKQAGQSVVSICCQEGKSMYISTWSQTASFAVCNMFDVKYYTQVGDESNQIDFIFYGLGPNTVTAAYGFETVYNLIMNWRMANKEAKGINGKNSYCRGVADGFYDFSKKEKRREEKEAEAAEMRRLEAQRKAEEAQRQKEIARLQLETIETKPELDRKVKIEDVKEESADVVDLPSPSFVHESDSDDDFGDDGYDDGDYGYDGNDGGSDFQAGLNMEEALEEDAVAPHFSSKEGVHDIDLDQLLKTSDERARKQAENPEALNKDKKKKRDIRRVKGDAMEDVKPTTGEANEVPKNKVKETEEPSWQSAGALIVFRQKSLLVAEEYLKKQGLKLHKRGKLAALTLKDANARQSYNKGWEDAKKINLKTKKIKASKFGG
ncbi:Ankyrin repeat protein [Lentinula edodes]|uniref:Ankyrin repeat protein n=1 Tax=Lentinula edodes TaxID=5353 RepID=A0A1Q3E433_LENED|nr:Ankyrin repeat protein [Lentinula edodes]